MAITGYVELATARQCDDLETEIGQKYAASIGKPWPMPPDVVGPGTFPCGLAVETPFAQLTPAQQALAPRQTRYVRALRHDDGVGGVLEVDEVIDALPGMTLTKRTREQLTARNRTLLDARQVRVGDEDVRVGESPLVLETDD